MLKLSILARRADGATHEQLVAHWRDVHAPNVIEHMRPDHYHLTFFDQRGDTPFDGMASLWFADADRGRRMTSEEAPDAVRNDGLVALVRPPFIMLASEEHVVVDGPAPEDALKLVALLNPKAGVRVDDLYKNWLEEHAPNVGRALEATDGGLRYVISLATQGPEAPAFAGFAELWYRDAAVAPAHAEKTVADGFNDLVDDVVVLAGHEIRVR